MNTDRSRQVRQLLRQAREKGQWYEGQADAAALCFDALALIPHHREAAELIYKLFCDEWLIYDMRVSLQQNIEEWDDRPFRQRKRLASSFLELSRWDGWDRPCLGCGEDLPEGPEDVIELLEDGDAQLLLACWLGDEYCLDFSWSMFTKAIRSTDDPNTALLWAGKRYAEYGYFADSADVLSEHCARFDDDQVRRLLVEVRWWRDNEHRLPWLPLAGDGSRYKRMMALANPAVLSEDKKHYKARAADHQKRWGHWRPVIDPDLAQQFADAVPSHKQDAAHTLIDWSFLDSSEPCEPPQWVKDLMKNIPESAEIYARDHRFTRIIQPPATPQRHDPNAPAFEPDEYYDVDEDDDEIEQDV